MTVVRLAVLVLVVTTAACAHRGPQGDLAGAQRALARELIARKSWAAAFKVADELCRTSPKDPESFLLRGMVYREQKLDREAEADFSEALKLDDGRADAHSALAVLLDGQGRAEEALKQHRRAVELEPRNPSYLNNLGFSLFARGRSRDAVGFFLEALRSAPADARIRNNLGFAYAAQGDLSRAAEQFEFAGPPAQAKNNLGWAYERRGSLVQAFDLYAEALRLEPSASSARQNLTRVARQLGRDVPSELLAQPGT
jgi:Flp pilus assembly protein TadD